MVGSIVSVQERTTIFAFCSPRGILHHSPAIVNHPPSSYASFAFLAVQETATLSLFTAAKGGSNGSQRNQEMRTSGLYLSGHFGEILQPAVRDDGRNPGRGLQVPSLDLRGPNGIRGPRIVSAGALRGASARRLLRSVQQSKWSPVKFVPALTCSDRA